VLGYSITKKVEGSCSKEINTEILRQDTGTTWILFSLLEEYICICGTLHIVISSVGNMNRQLVKGITMA